MKSKVAVGSLVLLVALVLGQVLAWLLNAQGYAVFLQTLPIILSQIAFWGPIIALIAGGFMPITLRLLGFKSLEYIRQESVEQNNPTPRDCLRGHPHRQHARPLAGDPALNACVHRLYFQPPQPRSRLPGGQPSAAHWSRA